MNDIQAQTLVLILDYAFGVLDLDTAVHNLEVVGVSKNQILDAIRALAKAAKIGVPTLEG